MIKKYIGFNRARKIRAFKTVWKLFFYYPANVTHIHTWVGSIHYTPHVDDCVYECVCVYLFIVYVCTDSPTDIRVIALCVGNSRESACKRTRTVNFNQLNVHLLLLLFSIYFFIFFIIIIYSLLFIHSLLLFTQYLMYREGDRKVNDQPMLDAIAWCKLCIALGNFLRTPGRWNIEEMRR